LTRSRGGGIASVVKSVELSAVRICGRCGRGRAELAAADGATLSVPLDPVCARDLAGSGRTDVPPLDVLMLAGLDAAGVALREVVLDVDAGVLRGLVTYARGDAVDVAGCAPQEAVRLAVRRGLRLYATDEAFTQAAARPGTGGSETLH
jgi:hypothetical protein